MGKQNNLIFSVIVTYHPNTQTLLNLTKQLLNQKVQVIIVDNTENSYISPPPEAQIIRLQENKGIATAQNYGIQKSIEQGAQFICFFDQDSQIEHDYIDKILNDWQIATAQSKKPVAAIGPRFRDVRHHFFYTVIKLNKFGLRKKIDVSQLTQPLEVSLIISSGSLISASALEKIGFMLDNFFIDYVDTEWCLRAISQGFSIFIGSQSIMEHAIGDKMIHLLGFNIPVHSPFRRYYRIRNAFFLFHLPYIPKTLAIREIIFNNIHQIILLISEKNRKENIKSWLTGIKDGIQGNFK